MIMNFKYSYFNIMNNGRIRYDNRTIGFPPWQDLVLLFLDDDDAVQFLKDHGVFDFRTNCECGGPLREMASRKWMLRCQNTADE
jgi:hypothetical protein